MQVSFIKQNSKVNIDKTVQIKKNTVSATISIEAIADAVNVTNKATVPNINVPKIDTSKQIAFLHIHFLNTQFSNKFAAKIEPNRTANPTADVINAIIISPVTVVIISLENNIPATIPTIILIITSTTQVPLHSHEHL